MAYEGILYDELTKSWSKDTGLKIYAIHEKPATATGENFFSDMLRITVEFARISPLGNEVPGIVETRSFIVKRAPGGGGGRQQLTEQQGLFPTELRVLRDILPKIERALNTQLGPRFIHVDETSLCTIVMEDLMPRGFVLKNRQEGMSMAHASLAIKNLAKFHAGSVALFEDNPEDVKSFEIGMYNDATPANMYALISSSLIRLSEVAENWAEEKCKLAAKKLRSLANRMEDRLKSVCDYEPNEFCVLNHGDAWVNNILFTEDEKGAPREQVFVDFQMAVFSSPAIDLLYFLYINPEVEIRGEAESALLNVYLDTLTTCMKKLGCKTRPPTPKELERSMHKRRAYAVMAGVFLLPRMVLDKEHIEDMDQLLEHGISNVNVFEKPKAMRLLRKILPVMLDANYLD